jgi:peptidoglycan/LPS O-acetylase OafA/YrhL
MTPAILATAPTPRYHALDGLRAAMMLLGIYLHVAVAYATIPGGWPYKQPELTGALNVTVVLIHIFRMPVFYVMAGFFAALLYARYGFRRAARNRFGRIVIPFVAGWAILLPLVSWLAGWRIERHIEPLHLWFLEYLLLLYALAVVAVPALARLPIRWRGALERGFRTAIDSRWAPLWFALPSFLIVLTMHEPGLDTPTSFIPIPRIVAAYAIPFTVGWLLHRNVDLLDAVSRRTGANALWALGATGGFAVLAALYFAGVIQRPSSLSWLFFVSRALHALAMWSLILTITGLFLRTLSAPSVTWRYLCDSSYFLYIAHMPVILAFQRLLDPVAIPPLAKVPLVLVGTTLVLLALYHVAVRPTIVGAVLNGRRYPVRLAPA